MVAGDPKLGAIIAAELGYYYEKYDMKPIAQIKAREHYTKVRNIYVW